MFKVGDKISAIITVEGEKEQRRQTKTGEVIYVHPKGRWFRARFRLENRAYREECFKMVDGNPLPHEGTIIRK